MIDPSLRDKGRDAYICKCHTNSHFDDDDQTLPMPESVCRVYMSYVGGSSGLAEADIHDITMSTVPLWYNVHNLFTVYTSSNLTSIYYIMYQHLSPYVNTQAWLSTHIKPMIDMDACGHLITHSINFRHMHTVLMS